MEANFVIYRSSAGSGKTYTLVKEYLLIALKNPDDFRHTLAITFTNKAMQEMKSRILEYLHDFIECKPHAMKQDLMDALDLDEQEFNKRCHILFNNILHKYSDFSISTIDAFFQRIIRSFTKELGIYGQYQLELDQDLVLLQATDDLIADLQENQDLTRWIIQFAEEQLNEGKSWDIRKALMDLGQEIFKEHFVTLENQLLNASEIKEFQKRLSEEVVKFHKTLENYSHQAFKAIKDNKLAPEEFSRGLNGALSFFNKIRKGAYDEPSGAVREASENIDKWVKKKCDRREILLSVSENHLMPLLNNCIDFYDTNSAKYNSCLAAHRFIYGLGLLSDLSKKIQNYKHERDLLFIQDATRLILQLLNESDSPFIFEKTGTFFKHYLIDEFQDTSALQWKCLMPLVYDTISSGNKSLLVGDTKQSIYRWRGGDWQLLQQQAEIDIQPQLTDIKFLQENYRSSQQVIQFNNELFKELPQTFHDLIKEEINSTDKQTNYLLDSLTEVYADAEQLAPTKAKADGYINISIVNDEENHWKEEVLLKLPETLNDLLNRGYRLSDIALLVRKKDEASELSQHLLSFTDEKGNSLYPVLTSEALMIGKARAVMIIINALKHLQDKEDIVALAELVYHYQKNRSSTVSFHSTRNKKELIKFLPEDFIHLERSVLHLSLEEMVEMIIRTFDLPGDSGEAAYVQTFQDKVLDFARAEGNDIPSFLQWWEEKGFKESIQVPGGIEAINIITIHKAKGLQYPIVILPFANWTLENNFSILWGSSFEEPISGIHLPLKSTLSLGNSFFKEHYFQEKLQNILDSINMLYVAFTRAEKELYAWIPDPKKIKKSKNNISSYLHQVVTGDDFALNENWSEKTQSFEFGIKLKHDQKEQKENVQVTIKKYLSHEWRDRMVVKKISSNEEIAEQTSRGRKMHYFLSRVKEIEDLEKLPFFKNFEDKELLQELYEVIDHEEIKTFFSKEWKVLNEKSILSKNEIYRPDRVVMKDSTAVIIDYKWGQEQKGYHKQIKNYLNLLQEMGFSAKGYLYYVDQKKVEKVA
ncbi:MAG: UvrD-helicase domain-containing protein [Candidatus Cyclobacteriaceae bacterium M2_1C_046]